MKKDKTLQVFKGIIFICFFVMMATFIFFTNYRASFDTPDRFFSERNDGDKQIKSSELIEEAKIMSHTKVYYHEVYDICGHEITYERPQGNNGLIAFTKAQLEALFPVYVVEEFSSDKVTLKYFKKGRCGDCNNFVFFGIKDGYVAIYYGKARENAEVKQMTDIKVDTLTQEVQNSLAKGITISNSNVEINTILEGLNS